MRVGIYDPYLDDLGGGEKYMMTIAECLSKENEVSVFWDRKEDLSDLVKRFSLNISKVKLEKNIFASNFGFKNKVLESKKFDVLIILSDGSIPVSLAKKTFLHIQQPLPFVKPNLKSKLKLMRINRVFVNSEFTKTFIDKELGIDSTVLYPPVRINAKKISKENVILHVGRFRVRDVITQNESKVEGVGDYKKQSIMVNAFKELIDAGLKNWKFVLATSVKDDDRKDFEKIKNLAKGYPIEFEVNRRNDDLWEIYSKAKIYWHASGFGEDLEKHPEFAEHFGISTVEAMGAGAVPVVINAGGQKEIIEEGTGFLWDTLDDLKEDTLALINDEISLKKYSESAKKRAQFFSDDKFCERISQLIRS